jgi:hypothetical protein
MKADLLNRVVAELREMANHGLPVGEVKDGPYSKVMGETATEFTEAATEVLVFILGSDISEARKDELIDCFLSACTAAEEAHRLTRDAVSRLLDENRTLKGRLKQKADSAAIDEIVRKACDAAWKKNPKLRETANGTAGEEFTDQVNAELKVLGLKPLEQDAIRKRVKKYQRDLKRMAVQSSN